MLVLLMLVLLLQVALDYSVTDLAGPAPASP